ncbi:hypothetical protein D3C87_1398130 [compost metagenome]
MRLFVDAVVMGNVAAWTQHAEETTRRVLRLELFGNQVVPGRTGSGNDRFGDGERAAVLQLHRQAHQRPGKRADAADSVITVNDAFVAFDPGQGQRRLRCNGLGQVEHFLLAAATATPADHAVLDHHVQPHAARGEIRAQISDVVRVIDHAIKVESRVSQ